MEHFQKFKVLMGCFTPQSALLKVYSDLNMALAMTCHTFGLLDLSVAFKTIDHDMLLKHLEVSYGIHGAPLNWMKSYVADRVQAIFVNG